MVKLCSMASHVHPHGLAIVFPQDQKRVIKDFQPYLPSWGARHEITRSSSLMLKLPQDEQPWRPMNRIYPSNQFAEIDSTVKIPILIDVQGLQHFGLFCWMDNCNIILMSFCVFLVFLSLKSLVFGLFFFPVFSFVKDSCQNRAKR